MSLESKTASAERSTGRGAVLVGAGILLSRLAGLIRERVFAHYFGNSDAADVFKAALRIPNFLQNLFGEGVLSASFIPVYARLRAQGREEEARTVARLIGLILFAVMLVLVSLGILVTPLLIDLIAPGFEGEKRLAAIQLVRVLFPGVGLLVMSAWCLGVLNSHGRFFLSYSAPVLWNTAVIGVLLFFGGRYESYPFALLVSWGVVLGSVLQLAVQVPSAFRLLSGDAQPARASRAGVGSVLRNFGPVVLGRGVVQISAYIDSLIASLLPTGAVSGLAYAQTIYLLPVSLFGMSVSAAELPAMASISGPEEETRRKLSEQLNRGLKRISFFVVPSAAAFLLLGDLVCNVLYKSGRFTQADSFYVWVILAGSTIGLLPATMGRLYSSAFYALHDTRTPLKFAALRVTLTLALGFFAALKLPPYLMLDLRWGVAGLTASSGVVAWLEFFLLRRALNNRIGNTGIEGRFLLRIWAVALLCAAAAFWTKGALLVVGSAASALLLAAYGAAYLGLCAALGIQEAGRMLKRAF